jgi:hypothetical protein
MSYLDVGVCTCAIDRPQKKEKKVNPETSSSKCQQLSQLLLTMTQ